MPPPYTITPEILNLLETVSRKIGEVNAAFLVKQSPELRKKNKIKTIQASLAVEENTLSVDQVTAIIENKRVLGPSREIKEVENAIQVYEKLELFNPLRKESFLKAHKILMQGLIPGAGTYRTSGVGIVEGSTLAHVAPPAGNVPFLMKDVFSYLKKTKEPALITSCVVHYEIEFIHPFADGNGRMGRLWQTLILLQQYPVFEYLPFETLISKNQRSYYKALSASDKRGSSTPFIEFMLQIINQSLDELLTERTGPVLKEDRIHSYLLIGIKEFTRKNYMTFFKTISSATASRDLQTAVALKLIRKKGEKNKSRYIVL